MKHIYTRTANISGHGPLRPRQGVAAFVPAALLAVAASCSDPQIIDDPPIEEPDEILEPGSYLSPLVQLQRLQGLNNHLHTDEVRLRSDGLLLQCSYTFGVVDTTNPAQLRYLSQNLRHSIPDDSRAPGCIHLAWDDNIVYTTHRGNIRNPAFLSGWDITNPSAPVQIPVIQEPGISYEGIDVANGHVFVGQHENGLGIYRRDEGNTLLRVGTATGFTNAWGVRARDNTVFVADGVGGLVTVDVTDPTDPRVLGRVSTGGQARGIALAGDIAYVASGSAGLVVVDISDLAYPTVIGRAQMPGTALRAEYSEGRVFVAAWNDARVYDVSEPASPRFIAAVRLTQPLRVEEDDRPAATSRILGIAARGTDVFVGNWHVLYSYRLHPDRVAPSMRLPENASMIDVGPAALGDSRIIPFKVTNQGTAPLTLINNWIYGSAYEVTPRQARIAPGETTTLSITFKPTTGERETGYLQILSDDPAAPLRTAFLVGNLPGLGVGMPLPETTGMLLDGGTWTSSQAEGQVRLINFFATFCPVCAGQLPDIEERFWQKYKDQGLVVVALNAHDGPEKIGEVDQYCENLRLSFPLGLEETGTYAGLTQNFIGTNPFPVDVIVDKDGQIVYVAREYDPDIMTEIIEGLLAE